MKVCYFGSYFRNYPRNEIIIEGLRQNKVEVIECHPGIDIQKHSLKNLPIIYMKLLKRVISLEKDFDIIIVGYPGWYTFWIAKILALYTRKPIVFDAFISLYNTMVHDRKIVNDRSIFAKCLIVLDKYSMKYADCCIADTIEHAKYFAETFHIPLDKIRKVPVGANETIFYPRNDEKKNEEINILFFGYVTPLHGLDVILKAAKLLEGDKNIKFTIIGKTREMKQNAVGEESENVQLLDPVAYTELPAFISRSQICLGIYGATQKATLVVPNKIYQCIAMKKAVITADTPAIKEDFEHCKNIYVCDKTPEALAQAILLLKNDENLRKEIALNAYQLFANNFTIKEIGRKMVEICFETIAKYKE